MRSRPTPERETAILFAVNAAHIQNLGIDHARAQNLDPAGSLANAAALAVAVDTGQIDLRRRLREREEARRKRVVTSSP